MSHLNELFRQPSEDEFLKKEWKNDTDPGARHLPIILKIK
jgi:hypothetical protein